jgi:hypothetical protein
MALASAARSWYSEQVADFEDQQGFARFSGGLHEGRGRGIT